MEIYFIKISENFELDLQKKKSINIDLKIKLTMKNFKFNGELLGWSNDEQKDVKYKKSFYATDIKNKKTRKKIKQHYHKLLKNYLYFLNKNITTKKELKKFINYIKHPKLNYHYKLINTFGYKRLDKFWRKNWEVLPLLDTTTLQFIPEKVVGWYYLGVEVNTDLGDEVVIEDMNGKEIQQLTPKQFFKLLNNRKNMEEDFLTW